MPYVGCRVGSFFRLMVLCGNTVVREQKIKGLGFVYTPNNICSFPR